MKNLSLHTILILFSCLLFASLVPLQETQKDKEEKKDKELAKLFKFMTGSFHSGEQAKADSANFFEVHLNMKPIWADRKVGYWLYVEQAMSTSLDKPYRQRVYHLIRKGDKIVSEVYNLNAPLRFAGAYKLAKPLANLSVDSLIKKEGCEIILEKVGKNFIGKTVEGACSSDLRGAKYATSEVNISKKQLYSWDKGFDASKNQVWGAKKSGYIFKKVKRY
jgi:CpeT protein